MVLQMLHSNMAVSSLFQPMERNSPRIMTRATYPTMRMRNIVKSAPKMTTL